MRPDKLELLSPAGNIEIFKNVVNAGADAVYFGGEKFGARAYAKNFSMEEGRKAIAYAHLYGRQAFLTVNTLLKNIEIEKQLYDYIRSYYESGIDAVIVQDMGVFGMLRSYFPELSIHASTQMTITESHGASYLKTLGASRIVTSREISIDEIRHIYEETGVEIESFVHGALCVCYSGQCLMSSMLGGRSGNRGRCAQPCRLPYDLLDDKGRLCQMPGAYLLSPKDLCGIQQIAALAEAGVYSFKIEGRMKQKEYAAGVVSLYRKYMDAYLEGRNAVVSKADQKKVYDLGNRKGFTNSYFFKKNDPDMITYSKPSHEKQTDTFSEISAAKIPLQGFACFLAGQPATLTLFGADDLMVTVTGDPVETADKRPLTVSQIRDKLSKTGNTPFYLSSLEIEAPDDIFLPISRINELRRLAFEKMERELRSRYTPERSVPLAFVPSDNKKNKQQPNAANDLLVICHTSDQFQAALDRSFVSRIAIPLEHWMEHRKLHLDLVKQECHQARGQKKTILLMLPAICRREQMIFLREIDSILTENLVDGVIASSYDALGYLDSIGYPKRKIYLDHRIYTFSNRSLDEFHAMGYERNCAPLELNAKELTYRRNKSSDLLIYGRIPLMITANCQHKNSQGCDQTSSVKYLQDRYKECFPVKNVCSFCYNEIYNSKICNLLAEQQVISSLGFRGYRMDLTFEDAKETDMILSLYEKYFLGTEYDIKFTDPNGIYTKGHFKRGVE